MLLPNINLVHPLMNDQNRKKHHKDSSIQPLSGFWSSAWRSRRDFISWDLPFSIVPALIVYFYCTRASITSVEQSFFSLTAGAAAALMGVIIAGLAIVAALMSDVFSAVLKRSTSGVEGDLWPFAYVAALCVATIVTSLLSLLFFAQMTVLESRWSIALATFLALYAFSAAMNLVIFVILQSSNRASLRSETKQDDM